MCALVALMQKDQYGYELVQKISKAVAISEGTMYPLLRRLKLDGYVTTYLKESREGPPRKYYQLTSDGEKMCKILTKEWKEFSNAINKFLTQKGV